MKSEIFRKAKSRALAATLLAAIGVGAALFPAINPVRALQVDQTRIMSKRDLGLQAMHYYRLTINYNDSNISTAQKFGGLGQNAYIYAIDCHVTTAFNAGTTNVVTMGIAPTGAELVASGTLNAASATVQHLTSAAGLGLAATSGGDVTLFAKYAQTGNAATAGSVTCVIQYAPNNDL